MRRWPQIARWLRQPIGPPDRGGVEDPVPLGRLVYGRGVLDILRTLAAKDLSAGEHFERIDPGRMAVVLPAWQRARPEIGSRGDGGSFARPDCA